jgi:hypothetical protein
MRRLTHVVCLAITLGIGFTPALAWAKEESLVENQPNPDSEIAPHVAAFPMLSVLCVVHHSSSNRFQVVGQKLHAVHHLY